jgi:hypothetical protein
MATVRIYEVISDIFKVKVIEFILVEIIRFHDINYAR